MKILVSLVFSLKQTIILQEKYVCVYMCLHVCVHNILKIIVILLESMLLNSDFEHMPSLTAIQVCL